MKNPVVSAEDLKGRSAKSFTFIFDELQNDFGGIAIFAKGGAYFYNDFTSPSRIELLLSG